MENKQKRKKTTPNGIRLMEAAEEGLLLHDQKLSGWGEEAWQEPWVCFQLPCLCLLLGVKSPLFISFLFHHPLQSSPTGLEVPPFSLFDILWQPSFQRSRKLRQTTAG